MPNQEEARRKLRILATNAKRGQDLTALERIRIEEALASKQIRSREDVVEVLEESLKKQANEISTALATRADTDRLMDEIIQALGS